MSQCMVCGVRTGVAQVPGNAVANKLKSILPPTCNIGCASYLCITCYGLINVYDYYSNETETLHSSINESHKGNLQSGSSSCSAQCVVCGVRTAALLVQVTPELCTQVSGKTVANKLASIFTSNCNTSSSSVCTTCIGLLNIYDYTLNETEAIQSKINKFYEGSLHCEQSEASSSSSSSSESSSSSSGDDGGQDDSFNEDNNLDLISQVVSPSHPPHWLATDDFELPHKIAVAPGPTHEAHIIKLTLPGFGGVKRKLNEDLEEVDPEEFTSDNSNSAVPAESDPPDNISENQPDKITDQQDNLKCNICQKSYHSKKYLAAHFKIHTEGKSTCPSCGKAFSSNHYRNHHMKTHGDVYVCKVCKKGFLQKANLNSHLATHNEYVVEVHYRKKKDKTPKVEEEDIGLCFDTPKRPTVV